MSFLKNIFQKKKTERIAKQAKPQKEKSVKKFAVKKPDEVAAEKKPAEKARPVVKKQTRAIKIAPHILETAHITEKAALLEGKNQYVFKVKPMANKNEIKKAVSERYNVKVVGVNIINVPKKTKRLGRTTGFKSGYKKAIVCLEKGQSIEILPR